MCFIGIVPFPHALFLSFFQVLDEPRQVQRQVQVRYTMEQKLLQYMIQPIMIYR